MLSRTETSTAGSPPSTAATTPAWPLAMWLVQAVVAAGVCVMGVVRLVQGPAPGRLVWTAMGASIAWLAAVLAVATSRRGRGWLIRNRYQLLLSTAMSVFALVVIGEAGVRVGGAADEDGNFYFRGHHLRPFQLPVKRVVAAVAAYRGATSSVIADDGDTGWAPRPGSRNDLYAYNEATMRVSVPSITYATAAAPGMLRISIFGDSFTNGVDEPYQQTWGARLQHALTTRGRSTEVLNFGVPGYGMDQAFLRWQKVGTPYQPAVVVFGLQIENVKRNVNLLRPLYNRFTDLPFAKPRFVLRDNRLEVLNVPVVPPEQLAATIAGIASWPLASAEAYYDPEDYRVRPWHVSRLATFAAQVAGQSAERDDRVATAEEGELALRILAAFKESVEQAGASFVIVHLPRRGDLAALDTTGSLPSGDLLRQVDMRFDFVETAGALLEEAKRTSLPSLFNQSSHYSAAANRVVSDVLARRLGEND